MTDRVEAERRGGPGRVEGFSPGAAALTCVQGSQEAPLLDLILPRGEGRGSGG